MSKRRCAVYMSIASSSEVERSINRVASFASLRTCATCRLRELCRPLPLPCAQSTTARAPSGRFRLPSSVTGPAVTRTSRSSIASSAVSVIDIPSLPPLHREGECFRRLADFPVRRGFERFDRLRLLEMEHHIELIRQTRLEVVALPLGFRAVDHADCALEARDAQLFRHRVVIVPAEQEAGAQGGMEERLIAAGQGRTDPLALRRTSPIGGGRHRAVMGGETDEHRIGAAFLARAPAELER